MLISVGFDIGLIFSQPTATTLMLSLHPSRLPSLTRPETLQVEPPVAVTGYLDLYGNRCNRLVAPAGLMTFRSSSVVQDDGLPDRQAPLARQTPVQLLPDDVLIFLLASRYCEVDSELKNVAASWFGHLTPGWPLVQGICDTVNRHIRFDYNQARSTRTALEAYKERTGVCRDFMHLAITFCRIMNIPARYCSGYLGDIGVPPGGPMDFSAWFEVFLDGTWYSFDARNNTPRIGRILMVRGRDAADTALTTTFGASTLASFKVHTDEVTA